jgi:hypothetical protein
MQTDYKNLNGFEVAAIFVAVIGVSLIGVQFYLALPSDVQVSVVAAVEVFNLNEQWQVQQEVNEFVFGGIEAFYDEFYIALADIAEPVIDQTVNLARDYRNAAYAVASYADYMSASYETNYYGFAQNNDSSMGGRVMGAFIQKLSE